MGNHKWENFSNPRNRRVSVIGCIKCGAMKGSAAEKRGGDCVATSLEKSTYGPRCMILNSRKIKA